MSPIIIQSRLFQVPGLVVLDEAFVFFGCFLFVLGFIFIVDFGFFIDESISYRVAATAFARTALYLM